MKGIVSDLFYKIVCFFKRLYKLGYKRKLIKSGLCIGEQSYLGDGVLIYHPKNVKIGTNVHINMNSRFYANYGIITISDNVTISPECRFIASGYELEKWQKLDIREHFEGKEIFIGKNNWICAGVTILPGVKITGEHVVVAAGAVVNKDITENNVIVAGVPARIVKRLGNENE